MKVGNRHDFNIIIGNINVEVGRGEMENCVRQYGMGQRNESGDRLIEFFSGWRTWFGCSSAELFTPAVNTFAMSIEDGTERRRGDDF